MCAFVGSLVGNRANRGVFVAASIFAADKYARDAQHHVELINGAEFVRLIVRHGVGVRFERFVIIKKLDEATSARNDGARAFGQCCSSAPANRSRIGGAPTVD